MNICFFNVPLARHIGVQETVFLQLLWQAIGQHPQLCQEHDGMIWFPCAVKDWEAYIPLWSGRQTDRIVKHCLQQQVLFVRHLDEDERRRRGWYAIHPQVIPLLQQTNDQLGPQSNPAQ